MKWRLAIGLALVAVVLLPLREVRAQSDAAVSGTIPLATSGLTVSGISTVAATISWNTNGDATSQVFYDTALHVDPGAYAFGTAEDSTLVISHSVVLSGLAAATTYHYRVKSTTADNLSVVSEDAVFTTLAVGGGGGGGGGGFGGGGGGGGGPTGPGVTNLTPYTNSEGLFSLGATAVSEDGRVKLNIGRGVLAKARDGSALRSVSILPVAEPAAPPTESQMMGPAYDLGPAGATFKPAVTLTITFDPAVLPVGLDEKNLMLVTWDAAAAAWVDLEAIVDAAGNSLSVTITRLGTFTLLAYTRPASFSVGDLTISPAEVDAGSRVSIGASVKNDGDLAGTYSAELKLNGKIESTQNVTVAGHGVQSISFSVVRDTPGSYEVGFGGLAGTFKVRNPPVPATFSLSQLTISRSEITLGEETNIGVVVTNTGDLAGTYTVTFRVDGVAVSVREVHVPAHAAQTVGYDAPGKVPGTFTVDVNGQAVSFTVTTWAAPPPKAPGKDWWLIGGIIAAVIAGAFWSSLSLRQRAR